MKDTRAVMTPNQVGALDADVAKAGLQIVTGMVLKHKTDHLTVIQHLIDFLAIQLRLVSPEGTAAYLDALTKIVTDLNGAGTITDDTQALLRSSQAQIGSDLALLCATPKGGA